MIDARVHVATLENPLPKKRNKKKTLVSCAKQKYN